LSTIDDHTSEYYNSFSQHNYLISYDFCLSIILKIHREAIYSATENLLVAGYAAYR